ncbi:MAG: hypothetical protein AAF939_11950, partial [Planctomycetota bacterium]
QFLNRENLLRVDLSEIAFRLQNQKFFQRVIEVLRNRYAFNDVLWSYAVKHNDLRALREFLDVSSLANQVGPALESAVLKVDPIERGWFEHKEYWPLVNSRSHQLGPSRKILNASFYSQYNRLLNTLAYQRDFDDEQRLVITYYLLLQDRVDAALKQFQTINRSKVECQMQYDYCDAYLDLYREQPESALAKVTVWADYPVDHWKARFQQIVAQVKEIQGASAKVIDSDDPSQQQTVLADRSESFEFEVRSGVAEIKHQNLERVRLNYYEMDIELLFSRSPFAQDDLEGFSMIRPNLSAVVELDSGEEGRGTTTFDLPEQMANKNVLVEVAAGDQTRSLPYFANSLNVQLQERFGQVKVAESKSGKAISKAYIKVYARLNDGTVRFHKDGYTDLRGKFDYVSQSNEPLDGVDRFAILIMSENQGAVIRQASRPLE